MLTKKRAAVLFLSAILAFTGLTGMAGAQRADGVCGGTGLVYDPVVGHCV